jgi:16S rRNA G966 N2-methylase RsmD
MDAVSALNRRLTQGKQFHLVFFDPPYLSDLYYSVPVVLASSELLAPGAILVIECSVRHQLPESFGLLRRFDRREYGDTALELFALEEI